MKEFTGFNDIDGKPILEGDVLIDNIPSKGIVIFAQGKYAVTSNYQGRDIRQVGQSDELNQDLITDNEMSILGNIHDDPSLAVS